MAHLFLRPDEVCVGVFIEMRGQQIIRQWGELLHSGDSNVVVALILSFLEELIVDLARTEDMSPDFFWLDQRLWVWLWDVSLENGLPGHFLQGRPGERVSK